MSNAARIICDFERSLKIGSQVRVCWTNSGSPWDGVATICKINRKSFKAKLLQHVAPGYFGGWPIGQEIRVPMFTSDTWGVNNRVEPVEGYNI